MGNPRAAGESGSGEGSSPGLRVPRPPRAPRRDLSERGGGGFGVPRAGDWGIWRFAGMAGGRWRRRADAGAKIWVPSAPVSESEELGGFENFERDAVVGGGRERGQDVVRKTTRRREREVCGSGGE